MHLQTIKSIFYKCPNATHSNYNYKQHIKYFECKRSELLCIRMHSSLCARTHTRWVRFICWDKWFVVFIGHCIAKWLVNWRKWAAAQFKLTAFLPAFSTHTHTHVRVSVRVHSLCFSHPLAAHCTHTSYLRNSTTWSVWLTKCSHSPSVTPSTFFGFTKIGTNLIKICIWRNELQK